MNIVVKTIIDTIGSAKRDYLEGEVKYDKGSCRLEDRGGVYGIAVKLDESEVETFFNNNNKKGEEVKVNEWRTIGEGYYPLYWGKDINLGSRLFEHMKASNTVASIQLDKKWSLLCDKSVIYGAVMCVDRHNWERELRKKYPDIYKTEMGI